MRAFRPSETISTLVHREQGEDNSALVGLELLPGSPDGGALVGGVLQLDDALRAGR